MQKFINIQSDKFNTNSVMVEVKYSLGGYNYWHGQENPRGIYLYLTPVNLVDCGGYQTWECVLGQGAACLLLELKRKSQKQINRCEDLIAKHVEELAKLFAEGNDPKVREMMRMMINVLN